MTSAALQRNVGRYELIRELGRGATSVVYLARQVDLDREVALKELSALRTVDPMVTQRFLRESRLAGSLTHPNVVTVYEYFDDDGVPFIAMEYLSRGSLRPFVGTLSLAQAGAVLEGVLAGLAHAHAHGVVHRDLKPENVLVTASGGVKITDFGIAKALDSESLLTLGGSTVGTPAYMAPEQALAGDIGPAADLYSAGVVAYELLTGHVPFHGSDVAMAVMLQHLNEPVPSLRAAQPELDPALCRWVERLLAKAPADRPASATDASDDLDEILISSIGPRWRRSGRLDERDGTARSAPAPRTSVTVPLQVHGVTGKPERSRRRKALVPAIVLGVALAAAGIAAAVVVAGRGGHETSAPPGSAESGPETVASAPTKPSVVENVRLRTGATDATATLTLTGRPLGKRSITVPDREIGDGHAWLELRQRGIEARVRRAVRGPLAVRVRTGRDVVRVDLAADPDRYETLRIERPNGRTVVVVLAAPAQTTSPPPSQTRPAQPTQPSQPTGSTGSPTTTTTTTPTKPKPPPVKTG